MECIMSGAYIRTGPYLACLLTLGNKLAVKEKFLLIF